MEDYKSKIVSTLLEIWTETDDKNFDYASPAQHEFCVTLFSYHQAKETKIFVVHPEKKKQEGTTNNMDVLIETLKDDIQQQQQKNKQNQNQQHHHHHNEGEEDGNIVIDNYKVDLDTLYSTFTTPFASSSSSSSSSEASSYPPLATNGLLENAIGKLNNLFQSELNSIKYQVSHYRPTSGVAGGNTTQDNNSSSIGSSSGSAIKSSTTSSSSDSNLNVSAASSSKISPNNNSSHNNALDNESEWRYLIDAEIADLYELVKELKNSLYRKKVTDREIESPSSPILSGKVNNVELYMHSATFTNILHLKNDLIQILQALPSTPTIPTKHQQHHLTVNNNNNNNNPVINIQNNNNATSNNNNIPTPSININNNNETIFKIPKITPTLIIDDNNTVRLQDNNTSLKSNNLDITVSRSAPSSPRTSRSRSSSTHSSSASTSRDHSPSPTKLNITNSNNNNNNGVVGDNNSQQCNILSSPLKKSSTMKNPNYQPGSFVVPRSPSKNNLTTKDNQSSISLLAATNSKKHPISSLSSRKSLDEQEEEMKNWISRTLNLELKDTSPHLPNDCPLSHHLRSGVVLCQLVNALANKTLIKKINHTPSAFFQIENIINFCQACNTLGLQDQDVPSPMDIHSSVNPKLFLQILKRKKKNGPCLFVCCKCTQLCIY
ncbi:hypothetical protein DFA_01046 [Cavenderia fasciculata]|uniref:Calponin-homology (CH) domain-containing protein n=1 Tax=Cavenderia fasciculata TaxID=261658 RepID=F4PQK4_CACFS|nr:uncharacterized protein DFA_01046 [Cavenderia fasciculata]EGG21171.1 hypothetical protein DFA_01046 [Cavenderia fasciculata]|eukprot:XP_004359021.1 hypothetical protein DFA_01046 [Cavenderia fasciculata]